jgi:hypothetical protein
VLQVRFFNFTYHSPGLKTAFGPIYSQLRQQDHSLERQQQQLSASVFLQCRGWR